MLPKARGAVILSSSAAARPAPRSFELASTKPLPSGVIINVNKAVGPLKNQP